MKTQASNCSAQQLFPDRFPLNLYKFIKNVTCPYAEGATISTICRWCTKSSYEANINSLVSHIEAYSTSIDNKLQSDAMAIEIPASICETPKKAGQLLFSLFSELYKNKSNARQTFEKRSNRDWRLIVFGVEFFCAFFAPFYGDNHSRYSGSDKFCWLMFQPGISFHRKRESRGYTKENLFQVAKEFVMRKKVKTPKDLGDYYKILPPPQNCTFYDWWGDLNPNCNNSCDYDEK